MWIFYLVLASLVSTMLPLPPGLSPADPTFFGLMSRGPITILIMTLADTGWGYLTFRHVDKVFDFVSTFEKVTIFFNEMFNQFKLRILAMATGSKKIFSFSHRIMFGEFDVQSFIRKWGELAMLVASATPVPFTLTIYAVSKSGYDKDFWFIISTLIGRGIKYAALFYSIQLGLKLF